MIPVLQNNPSDTKLSSFFSPLLKSEQMLKKVFPSKITRPAGSALVSQN